MVPDASWAKTQARLHSIKYTPLVFPVEESLETIFRSSSKEKNSTMSNAKAKINAHIALKAFFENTKSKIDKALSPIINNRNLYPPSFLKILGEIKSSSIEKSDAPM